MPSKTKKAVALLSSGLDSSVACVLAQAYDCDIATAVTFDYGQRSAAREIAGAKRIADHLGVSHRTIDLPWFREFTSGGKLLSSSGDLPQPTTAQLSDLDYGAESAKAVWVPNRNGVMIEVAAGIAEEAGAQIIIVGFNQEEAATFPDNSTEYLIAISYALSFSTANHVQVLSPTSRMDKTAIVREAIQHKFPLDLIWSCYESGPKMCGRCESCMRLKRALAANEVEHGSFFADPSVQ